MIMDVRLFYRIYKQCPLLQMKRLSLTESRRLLCSSTSTDDHIKQADTTERDPLTCFFDPLMQTLLKRLTVFNAERSAELRRSSRRAKVKYAFVTDEMLKQMQDKYRKRETGKILNMPPVMKPWPPINKVLAKNEEIAGLYPDKFVFTDITPNIPKQERIMVVREPDGTLRLAEHEERDRMTQLYYPEEGKTIHPPSMFKDEHLLHMMDNDKHAYVLDRACLQFEPNDPRYIDLTHKIYDNIKRNNKYDSLRYTRYFGPMVFHLAWHFDVDGLIKDIVERSELLDAVEVIAVTSLLHPDKNISVNPAKTQKYSVDRQIDIIQQFVEDHVHLKDRGQIELVLQSVRSSIKEQEGEEAAS